MIPQEAYDDMNDSGHGSDEQPTSSMDFANEGVFDVTTDGGSGRQLDRNALVLVVIIVAAIGGLWSMRTLSPTHADGPESVQLPENVGVEPLDKSVMQRLAAPAIIDRGMTIERDPFALWSPAPLTDEAALIEEFVDDGIVDRASMCSEWKMEVERISNLLKLKSVLGGGSSRALVNIEGVLLTIGETFDIAETDLEFTVEGTGRRSVRLGAYNAGLDCWHEVEVSMDVD